MKNVSMILLVVVLCGSVLAAPPLPLHQTEGNSGVFITQTAYLANPAEEGQTFGKPSVSSSFALLGQKDYESIAFTQNILGDFEIGVAMERLGLGDWSRAVRTATGGALSPDNQVTKYNFNVRYNFIKEGSMDCAWMPAITVGTHFKWNDSLSKIDRQLAGTCDAIGADHSFGTEFTLVATKMFKEAFFGKPMILSAGLRNGDAIHTGFLGFAGERRTTFEGSVVVFLTDKLLFASEYRQKSNLADECVVGGTKLVNAEDDWYDFCLAYIVNDNMTVSGGYANFGSVLEAQASNVWALQMKYEF